MRFKIIHQALCVRRTVIDEVVSSTPNRDSITGSEVVILVPVIDLFTDVLNHEELHSIARSCTTECPVVTG